MSINKRDRFEIFKRDSFTCQYCGKTPPDVMLEIDHINPKSRGGKDDINNYITACFDCNRGKSNIALTTIPNSLSINLKILKEKEAQLGEYNKFIQKIEGRIQREIAEVDNIFGNEFSDWGLTDSFKNTSLRNFLNKLPLSVVLEAMRNSCDRMMDKYGDKERAADETIRYFCGYCWKKIRG